MTVILYILLVAQPAADESSRVAQRLAVQLSEAIRVAEDDPDEALRRLNALLDDPKSRELERRSPVIRFYREQALYFRGRVQLRLQQAQAVANDMSVLLDRKRARLFMRPAGLVGALASPRADGALGAVVQLTPSVPFSRLDYLTALRLRAEAYEALSRHDEAQTDRDEADEILREWSQSRGVNPSRLPIPSAGHSALRGGGHWWRFSPLMVSLIVAGVFVAMVPVYLLAGRRQRREAGGTWRRLIWVAVALAGLQAVPVLFALLLLQWRPELYYVPDLFFVTFVVFGVNIARHLSYLVALTWMHSREAPPLLDDPVILGRIADIAGRMGIVPPATRLARSPTSLQQNNAGVSGLAAPTMVLFDGILYRLAEEERDAVIAHELAHLANHTFWYWLVSGIVCSVAVVAASTIYHAGVVLALGLALWMGTWLILSRWLELDCDRRAARAIGHRRTASALRKIHADQPFRGLVEFLIGAVASHPSRDERLAAIYRDSPDYDKPDVEWDARLLRYRRLAAWCAAGTWLGVIAGCLWWSYRWPESRWPAWSMVLMVVALIALFLLGLRKPMRRQRRLQRTRRVWRRRLIWLLAVLLVSYWASETFGLTGRFLSPLATHVTALVSFLSLLVLIAILGRDRASKLNQRIVIAIQSGDLPKALSLAEASPAVVARSTELRYNLALVLAMLGRREEALHDLEQLRRDEPGFKLTWLLVLNLHADEGDYPRALELAEQVSRDLPGEVDGPQAESWLLRKLGRLEAAETRAREVLRMEPHSGIAHLTLASVALDRGDHAAAREELAQAERLVPGSVSAALFAAEMALATGDGAEGAVDRAVKAVKNNPLSFAEKEVARLVGRLEERRQDSAMSGPTSAS
jgi:Zn-dependent protease with chaperone function